MDARQAAGVRLIVSFAAGLLLYAGTVPHPPSGAREADKPGEAVWSDTSRDKLGPVVRLLGGPAQDGPGAPAFRPDGGRTSRHRPEARVLPVRPERPMIVDFRLGLLAPLKFATNYVDVVPESGRWRTESAET
jgi:hypothetical protein